MIQMYRSYIPFVCVLLFFSFHSTAQKLDPKEYQKEIELGKQLFTHEQSSMKIKQFMDSMPYSKHKDTYITYMEGGEYTHVFWEERETEEERKELIVNFVAKTFYPFAFRNTTILEQDFIPNDKDYKFIRAQKRFNTAKLLMTPFQGFYERGDKLIPVFMEEGGRIVAYVRRIPRRGLPRLGDGFKIYFTSSQQIGEVVPLTASTYSVANITSSGDLVIKLSKKDCRKNSISPLLVRDILVYKDVFKWKRVVMYCNSNLIVYTAATDSWLIEPEQKYGEWIKRNVGKQNP